MSLIFVVYMIYNFLIKMNFYRECHLTTFYILAVLVLLLRIQYFVQSIIGYYGAYDDDKTGRTLKNCSDSLNTYLKVGIGLV